MVMLAEHYDFVIGGDPDRDTIDLAVLDTGAGRVHAHVVDTADGAGYRRMLAWAGEHAPGRRIWALEGTGSFAAGLVVVLAEAGETVVEVGALKRARGAKNDRIDAAAAASVAALQGQSRPLEPEGGTDALALLDESRMNLAQSRVRLINQLHALLRELLAGGAPRDLSVSTAAALLRRVRPIGDVERVRKQIAAGLVAQIRSVDALLRSNAQQISERVAASGSTLPSTVGIGAITAGRLIGRTGRAGRFPSSASFANYAGAAPVEVASADKARHRLSRVVTANSTPRCTPSRSPRSERQAAADTRTTTPRSPRASQLGKHDGV